MKKHVVKRLIGGQPYRFNILGVRGAQVAFSVNDTYGGGRSAIDRDRAGGGGGGNAGSHRDSVVAGGRDHPGVEAAGAGDGKPIVGSFGHSSEGSDHCHRRGDSVALLDAQFRGVPHHGGALGVGGEHGNEWKLVDGAGGEWSGDFDAAQPATGYRHHAGRITVDGPRDLANHVGPHVLEDRQHAEPAGVQRHVGGGYPGAFDDRRRRPQVGGARRVAGNLVLGRRDQPRIDTKHSAVLAVSKPEGFEPPLGVVPVAGRALHRGRPLGLKSGELEGGSHLCRRQIDHGRAPDQPTSTRDHRRVPVLAHPNGGS